MCKKIQNFIQSQDYKDISYMIKHVNEEDVRIDVLKQLGYHIGIDIIKNDQGVYNVQIGKRNEIRMQVTPKNPKLNIAYCVMIEN